MQAKDMLKYTIQNRLVGIPLLQKKNKNKGRK